MAPNITNQDEDTIEEIKEIGCMCIKCNCKKMTPLVVAICDSCLSGKHTSEIVYAIKVESERKRRIWRLEYMEPLPQDFDEQNDENEISEEST